MSHSQNPRLWGGEEKQTWEGEAAPAGVGPGSAHKKKFRLRPAGLAEFGKFLNVKIPVVLLNREKNLL